MNMFVAYVYCNRVGPVRDTEEEAVKAYFELYPEESMRPDLFVGSVDIVFSERKIFDNRGHIK